MKSSQLTKLLFFTILVFFITSCTPGSENFNEETAGFLMGLWHGFISLFSFIGSLFIDNLGIYEINNNGNWYNFGFILGVSMFFGGSGKGCCRRK
jgi:hypothetical protein